MRTLCICPDCGATLVQDGPIQPACTYCAEGDGWFKDTDGLWKSPNMRETG